MYPLQSLRLRSEGCGLDIDYDSVLDKFRCTSCSVPPPEHVDSRLLSCCFAKKEGEGHILAVTCEDGQILILNTHYSNSNSYLYNLTDLEDDTNALFSVEWSDVDMKLVTTSGDHAVALWNLQEGGMLRKINSFKAHRCSVKTACFRPRNSDIFASGGRDGNIYVWDSRTSRSNEPEQYINNCHKKAINKNENSSITSIVFQDDFKLISCADTDSNINVWDLRKTYLRTTDKPIPVYQLPSPMKNCVYGYTHMVMNKLGTKLFANSLGHHIYCFNISAYSKTPVNSYFGHSVRNFFSKMSLSPDDKYIASTDTDDKIFIWKIRSPGKPIVVLSGQPDMLNGLSDISWCPEDRLKLATSSDYPSPWIWTVPPQNDEPPPSAEDFDSNEISFAKSLRIIPVKCKRNSAMISKLYQNRKSPFEPLSSLKLPNSVIDGFQMHMCATEKKPVVINNWLTNLHNQLAKRATPDEEQKTLSSLAKNKKRKKASMSPGSNLIKYLRKHDENDSSEH